MVYGPPIPIPFPPSPCATETAGFLIGDVADGWVALNVHIEDMCIGDVGMRRWKCKGCGGAWLGQRVVRNKGGESCMGGDVV